MEQLNQYFIFFLYTGGFCLALTLGLTVLLSSREFVQPDKLRRFFSIGLLLLGIHLLCGAFFPFFGPVLLLVTKYLLVAVDLAFLIFLLVALLGSLRLTDNPSMASSSSANADASGQDTAGSQPAAATQFADTETAAAQTVDKPQATAGISEFEEESDADALSDEAADESADDDSDNVEKLENPNVDDFLFFQKVEALMVNEMLFCEQELSRESLATAIGTNRTYLARSIKSATGKTFSEYITNLRTAYAAKLLTTTDEPLDLIGTLVGFRSKSAYYRAFAAAYNCSPSEYRKNSVCRSLDK